MAVNPLQALFDQFTGIPTRQVQAPPIYSQVPVTPVQSSPLPPVGQIPAQGLDPRAQRLPGQMALPMMNAPQIAAAGAPQIPVPGPMGDTLAPSSFGALLADSAPQAVPGEEYSAVAPPVDQISQGTDVPVPRDASQLTNDAAGTTGLKSEWDSFIQNNRAAMLSFGLQALSGGWGNGMQQFAHALGKGLETAGNQEAIAQEQANKDASLGMQQQRIDQDERQHRDNMALSRERIRSQEKISREQLETTLSRDDQKQYQQLVMQNLKLLMAPQGLNNTPGMTLEEALPLAKAQADAATGRAINSQLPGNLSSGNGQQSSAGTSGPGSANGRVEPTSGRTKEEQISPNDLPRPRRNKQGQIVDYNPATNRWELRKGQ